MVQLKVSFQLQPTSPKLISIPYGSIKSMIQILALTAAALFQFLMVQLKVYHPNLGQSRRIFQFLMVQLKA